MKCIRRAALAALLAAVSAAQAHEYTAGALVIDHPMAHETAPTAMTGGGFLTITNTGDAPDRLLAVRADYPKVELHLSEERDGVMRMLPVESLEIPPGESVMLQPGGFHVMFMGLKGRPFEAGQEIPAVLVFEKAGEVPVAFRVETRSGAAPGGTAPAGNDVGMEHDMAH